MNCSVPEVENFLIWIDGLIVLDIFGDGVLVLENIGNKQDFKVDVGDDDFDISLDPFCSSKVLNFTVFPKGIVLLRK